MIKKLFDNDTQNGRIARLFLVLAIALFVSAWLATSLLFALKTILVFSVLTLTPTITVKYLDGDFNK